MMPGSFTVLITNMCGSVVTSSPPATLTFSPGAINWTNTSGGSWSVASNWSPNQVPGATNNAFITMNGAYTVNLDESATVASLTLGGSGGTQSFVANANTLTLNGASTVGNNGSFNLDGGTLTGAGSFTINGPFNLSGGALGGSGPVTVNGPFNWSGGRIYNTGGVTINGASSLNGGNDVMFLYGLLINAGTLTWSGSANNLYFSSGTLTDLATGTITISADVSTYGTGGTMVNAGHLLKTNTTGTTTLNSVALVNTGDVQAQSGTLDLADGGSASGTFEASSNATLQFDNGTYTLDPASRVTGAGTVLISSGTVTLSGTLSLSGTATISGGTLTANTPANMSVTNLILSGGALGGSGPVTVNGPFNWSGGTIYNTAGVTLNGASGLNGGNGVMYLYGLLINAGTLTWSGSANNFFFNFGTLTNLATGTITISADVSTNGTGGTMVNAGHLLKTNSTGTTTLNSVALVNTGKLDAQSGTINLAGGYSLTNGTLNFGISSLTNFGTISLSGAAGLTGIASANLNNGYQPIAGNSFAVLTYASRTGFFTNTELPFADAWQTNYTTTNFTLVVLNARPTLNSVATQTVNELTLLTVTNTATDPNRPARTLIFSLVSGPGGMTINSNSGVIAWTPQQTNSPSTNTVVVSVANNGTPPLSATNSFTVIVKEVNVAPSLPVISQETVNDLALLTVTNTATETNIHSITLGYGLISPPTPTGAGISANGIITWTPSQSQGPSTNTITTVVTNSNPYDLVKPNLTATNSFKVIVFAPVILTCSRNNSALTLSWSQGTLLQATNLLGPWLRMAAPRHSR